MKYATEMAMAKMQIYRQHGEGISLLSFFKNKGNRLQIKVKVKLSLCLKNYALRHKGLWGSGCIDPYFLDFRTSWR
jgi:hypothetical protein